MNQQAILDKLGIISLNPMQLEAGKVIPNHPETILLSPTGTGKTLAYLLPLLSKLDSDCREVQ
ncbi:MAG: ATP-dependent helicase, partial [Paludibacter sp.]|nr:ATP-dependent helicase [Paludibacter sp.]